MSPGNADRKQPLSRSKPAMGQQTNPSILSKPVKTTHCSPGVFCFLPTSLGTDSRSTWDSWWDMGRTCGKQRRNWISQHATLESNSLRKLGFISSAAQGRLFVLPSKEMLNSKRSASLRYLSRSKCQHKIFPGINKTLVQSLLLTVKSFRLSRIYLHTEVTIQYMI